MWKISRGRKACLKETIKGIDNKDGEEMINKLFKKNWVAIDKILCEFNNEFCAKKGKNLKQEFDLWKKNLTKEEIKALKKYRRGTIKAGKRNINAYLREGILNDIDKYNA